MSSVSFDGREFQKISSGFADHRIPTNRNSIINKPSIVIPLPEHLTLLGFHNQA